jgi:hypothetical protein
MSEQLVADERLNRNDRLTSGNGRYYVIYQGDGNLVLYEVNGGATWSSRTAGNSVGYFIMQGDGNAVIYDAERRAVWSSGTEGNRGSRIIVQNDGNLVIYDRQNQALWSAWSDNALLPPPEWCSVIVTRTDWDPDPNRREDNIRAATRAEAEQIAATTAQQLEATGFTVLSIDVREGRC